MAKGAKSTANDTRSVPFNESDTGDEENAELLRERQREQEAAREYRADMLADLDSMEDGEFFKAVEELEQTEGVKFIVSRVSPPNEAGYVGTLPASEMTMENVKLQFGAGKYRIRAQGPRGFVAGGGTVTVAKFVAHPMGTALVPASPSQQPDYFAIQRAMDERQHARMLSTITILAPILTAMFGSKSQGMDIPALIAALKPAPGPSLTDLTTSLANLNSISGDKSGGSELEKMMSFYRMISELKSDDRESSWIDVVKAVAEPLVGKVGGLATAGLVPAPRAVRQLPKTENVLATEVPQNEISGDNVNMLAMAGWMRESLDYLARQAARDKSPELYAEWLLDNLPEGVPESQLQQWLGREDWWNILVNFHASVSPHQGWFTELRKVALELIASNEVEKNGPSVDKTPS